MVPLMMEGHPRLGIVSKALWGIREALGAVVEVFLQSALYVSPELEEAKGLGGAIADLRPQQAHEPSLRRYHFPHDVLSRNPVIASLSLPKCLQ